MAFVKIDRNLIDVVTLELHPEYKYTSSSLTGETGTVNVKPRPDKVLKESHRAGSFWEEFAEDGTVEPETALQTYIDYASALGLTDISVWMQEYMSLVNNRALSFRNDKDLGVFRFDPPFFFNENTEIKNIIKNNLMPAYKIPYQDCDFSYTNYNSLNFFTSDSVPSTSVLMYPTPPGSGGGRTLGRYVPEGPFSVDFYINPRYQNESGAAFHAGTILHLSSTLAVSLISGSNIDQFGKSTGFRIMLQMGDSADIAPSLVDIAAIDAGTAPTTQKIFLSEDNSMTHKHWHHVCARWGGSMINNGTGSIRIDESSEDFFYVAGDTVTPTPGELSAVGKNPVDVLFVGNFYDGPNDWDDSPFKNPGIDVSTSRFFYGIHAEELFSPEDDILNHDGILWGDTKADVTGWVTYDLDVPVPYGAHNVPLYVYPAAGPAAIDTTGDGVLNSFEHFSDADTLPEDYTGASHCKFEHPLNAEIHELKLYDRYLYSKEVDAFETSNPESFILTGSLLFYLPPSFTKESPARQVLVSPFQEIPGYEDGGVTTDDPFNVSFSFGVGGHMLNLENFVREFRHGIYPRLFNLTGSMIDSTTVEVDDTAYDDDVDGDGTGTSQGTLANDFIYATGSLRKRNLTVLPCDNGLFSPTFSHLVSGSISGSLDGTHPMEKFKNSLGNYDISKVSLENLVPKSTLFPGLIQSDNSEILEAIMGASPENPGVSPGAVLTIFQRTRDGSSNEITIFDISNLTFGNRIEPETFKLYDSALTGSDGKVPMIIKDNGRGSLYRADCLTKQAEWNNVGNIFYAEGIAIIKAPTIPFFGIDQHEVSFKGEQNLHILTVDAKASKRQINNSTNPSFLPLSASLDVNNEDNSFVYISGINFHDENFNIIMRTNLTQPIKKKESDEFVFRVKMDF
jgi:hypothetical protein